jgi:hypothetical protein
MVVIRSCLGVSFHGMLQSAQLQGHVLPAGTDNPQGAILFL